MLIVKILCLGIDKNNVGDYTYEVLVNRDVIARGEHLGHQRDDGWAKLVYDIAKKHLKESADE